MATDPDRNQALIVGLHREVGEVAVRVGHVHDLLTRVERDLKINLEKIESRHAALSERMDAADRAAARASAAIAVVLGLLSSIAGSLGSSKIAAWISRLLG